jgi:hypothetical protein
MEDVKKVDEKVRGRLMARRKVDEENGCWLYLGTVVGNGYGRIWDGSQVEYVHRVSAALFLGFERSSGLCVLHRCDTPVCFNPDHLFTGTQKDNMSDAAAKGRMSGKKLDPHAVAEIKRLLQEGWSQRQIGLQYGVSSTAIGQIKRGETWANVRSARADEMEADSGDA